MLKTPSLHFLIYEKNPPDINLHLIVMESFTFPLTDM